MSGVTKSGKNGKSRKMEDTDTNEQLIAYALQMWANFMETGDVCLSALDLEVQNPTGGKKIKALSVFQMKRIIRLRELAGDLQSKKLYVPYLEGTIKKRGN